jgi:hypothetical protein
VSVVRVLTTLILVGASAAIQADGSISATNPDLPRGILSIVAFARTRTSERDGNYADKHRRS